MDVAFQSFHQICGVVDFDGYSFHDTFHVREMGWCDHSFTQHYTYHYFIASPYPKGDRKACSTIAYAYKHCHGLAYHPKYKCRKPARLENDFLKIYAQQPKDKPFVAYKGGHIEKDFLARLGVPAVDLEWFGCPKYDSIKDLSTIASCGHHRDCRKHHCPKAECACFMSWVKLRL